MRKTEKGISKNYERAVKLWESGMHEARIFASYIDEVDKVTEKQIEEWVKDFS